MQNPRSSVGHSMADGTGKVDLAPLWVRPARGRRGWWVAMGPERDPRGGLPAEWRRVRHRLKGLKPCPS